MDWRKVNDFDGNTLWVNLDNVVALARLDNPNRTAISYAYPATTEDPSFIFVKETPEEILNDQPPKRIDK